MATTVDQKVVQMKFDNRDFEQNVKVSMSTLDKLKAKLHLDGASKGLENVSAAARKVNMDGLADGIQTVSAKFSAMEVIGVTALANITNSAVTAGLQLAKSLTVDQVSSGWNKMNQKIGSVQTLVNSTGLSVEEIDEYLSQLMWYSDETSYSFTDMTASLAQMTSTGGDIKKLVPMIRGIANATAYAGKGAAEFSRVIYNLNQSYGAGYLQLMDWKSVQLAGANSKQLTEELIKAGEELGTIQKGQVTIGNFNESLKDKWATTEVMEKAFARFDQLSSAAYEAVEQGFVEMADGTKQPVKTCAEAIDLLADRYDELAVKAFRSAQEAKSFKEAIDATADATSSAWMEIFTAIFGGYNEQKRIFTDLANWLYEVFVDPLYSLEEVVRNAFDFSGFETMWNKLTDNSLVKTMEKVSDSIKTTTRTLEEYQDIVTKVWRGDFNNRGDNPDRFDLLSQAGWDPKVVQELVNQTDRMAGYGKGWTVIGELTIDDVRKAEEKYGISVKDTTKEVSKQADVTEDLNKKLQNLSEEQLKEMGLSDEEVRMYQSLQRASKKYGKSMDEIIKKMSEMSGRDLVFGKGAVDDADHVPGIFQNIAGALGNVANAAKTAWAETFKPFGGAELYMIINNLWEFTNRLKEASSQKKFVDNLTDAFKGLFSILKLVTTIMGGGFKIAWTIFSTVCQTLGYDVLDVAGAIGNLTSKIVNFITENEFIIKGVVWLTQTIAGAIVKFHDWITSFVSLNGILHTFQDVLAKAKEGFSDWLKGLKEQQGIGNIAKYIFEGLINGIKTYGGKALSAMWDFGTQLIATIKEKLGIHSPSTVFFAIGGFLIAGLIAGLKSQQVSLFDFLSGIGNKMIEIFKSIDLSDIFVMASTAGLIYGFVKLSKGISILAEGLHKLNGVIDAAKSVFATFNGVLKSFKIKIITSSIKDIAVAIAILVASIWVLCQLNIGQVFACIGAIATLAVVLGAFAVAAGFFAKTGGSFGKVALLVLAIGVAFKMMASVVKKMGDLDKGQIKQGTDALWQFVEMIGVLMVATVLMSGSKNVDRIGSTLLKVSAAFLIMGIVVKSLGKIKKGQLEQGVNVLATFELMILALMACTKLITGSNNVDKIGGALLKISLAFILMGTVVKSMGKMDQAQLKQGMKALTAFEVLIIGLMGATKLIVGSKNIDKIGGMIAKIGVAFVAMALAVKLLGNMKPNELKQGGIAIAAFTVVVAGLVWLTKKYKGEVDGVGKMMLGIGGAMLLMAVTIGLLAMFSPTDLAKGAAVVAGMGYLVKVLIESTKGATSAAGTILAFTALVGVIALAIGILSIIDPKKLAGPVLAMGIMMTLATLMLYFVNKISKMGDAGAAMKNVTALAIIIGALGAAVFILSFINADNAIKSTAALALLAVTMTAMLYALNNIKIDMKSVLTAVVGMAALVAALYGVVGALALMQGIENAAANTVVLTAFMAAMTLCLIGVAAAGAIYAVSGGMALLGLVGLAGILVALLGVVGILALMNAVPNAAANTLLLTSFMSIMCGMLTQLAIVGPLALVGVAALTGLMTLMPILILFATAIGALVTYIPALQEFMNTGMQVMINLAGGLGEMIGAFVNGVLTQISSGLPQIGKDLSAFVTAAMPFIVGIKMADGNTLKGVGIITASVLALTVAELINGIGKLLTFGGGLKQLGTDLSAFMIAALPFLTIASTLNANMMKGVESLSKAVLMLTAAELIQGIVNFVTGGGSSLQEFGAQLPGLGTNLAGFVTNLGTFTDEQANTVKCAGDAIVNLAEAAKKLPNEGGWIASICGDNSLATFGESLPAIGTNIKDFVANLGVFTDDQVKTAKCASDVIVALAEAAKKIPNEGGLWAKIAGDNSLADFADKLPDVAGGIKGFVDKLGNFGNKTESAKAAAEIIKGIANLADKGANKDKGKQLTEFANELPPFAEKLKTFITTMSSLSKESTETAADNTKVIVDAANNMMKTIKDNITAKSTDIVTASEEVGKKSADGFNSQAVKDKLKNQAYNFVKGFADGVTSNSNLAEEAARQVAQKALDASQKKLDEHSPSRETLQQGQYFGEGFIIGLKQYSSRVYSMSGQMADEAKKGLANALTNISSLVESDIDTNPTIRPVLDLSEVSDGASRIGSMLNGNRVGVSANLNSISSGMNARSQNGNNSDVVSAINKLGKNIDNRPGNTYNINGINTNGDTAIENAVNTLIRAIEVERRV